MLETITAIYENGILRPLVPLTLHERQTVQIQILPFQNPDETQAAIDLLVKAGLLTPPAGESEFEPVSAAERRNLATVLSKADAKPLSEVIIEERGTW